MKMRNSGIPALGKIPKHWDVTRLKFHLKSIVQGWSPQCEVLPAGSGDWGVLKAGCVNGDTFNESENKRLPDQETPLPEFEVRAHDVLMSRANTTDLVGSATIVPADVRPRLLLSDKLYRLEVNAGELLPEFLVYALRTPTARVTFECAASGASNSMQNINQEVVRNLWLPVPPIDEQRAIVAHLVDETARLDALLPAKQRVLDLLAEKRKAIIATAVTRGLDPTVRLSDSGVPWLGEIPAHWEIERTRWLFRERDQRGEPELPLMEVSIATGVTVREFSEDRIEGTAADFGTYKVARRGDIAFNKMRMWQGAVGVVPTDGLVSPDYVVAEPTGGMMPEYAGLLFRTPAFSAECGRRSHGLTWDRLRIYWEEFREIELPAPPLEEQHAIVAHIARETAKLDAVRAATERTISLLKERRAALIAAAVTGQLDVTRSAA